MVETFSITRPMLVTFVMSAGAPHTASFARLMVMQEVNATETVGRMDIVRDAPFLNKRTLKNSSRFSIKKLNF